LSAANRVQRAEIVTQLLKANGIDGRNAKLMETTLSSDVGQLTSGKADAAIVILPPESERIQELLRIPDICLMDFTPEAEAYTNRFSGID
jgi:TRAP-type uncharacterized transport system substrate-binding protein